MAANSERSPYLIQSIALALIVLTAIGIFLYFDSQPNIAPAEKEATIEEESFSIEEVDITPTIPTLEKQAILEHEASTFVENLADGSPENNVVDLEESSGRFIRHDGTVVIPQTETKQTTLSALQNDKSLSPDEPISIEFVETQKQTLSLDELNNKITDKDQAIIIEQADGSQTNTTMKQLLTSPSIDREQTVTIVTKQNVTQSVTVDELAQLDIDPNQTITATVTTITEIPVKKIVQSEILADDDLFYLHQVTKEDTQGLWGIIQSGLIQRFREGLQLEGISRNKDYVQVTIPADADERLDNGFSSFLGKILDNKVDSSYIYNYTTNSMGHDPNLVQPGQQLILIHFSQDELKNIYRFFADKREENAQSFAIEN